MIGKVLEGKGGQMGCGVRYPDNYRVGAGWLAPAGVPSYTHLSGLCVHQGVPRCPHIHTKVAYTNVYHGGINFPLECI